MAAAVLLAGIGATPLAVSPAGAAPSSPRQDASAGASTATMALASQPTSVAPDGSFPVFLSIRGAPAGSRVVADLYPRADDAADLAATGDPDVSFDPVPVVPDGEGGQAAVFAIDLHRPQDPAPPGPFAYELDEPGVYPIRIRLQDAGDARLGTLVTSLIRRPDADQVAPTTEVALVTTVHADLPEDAEDRARVDVADPDLVADLAPVLEAFDDRPSVPAAFAVTPDTAARLAADAPAIAALRSALAPEGRELLDAPYVDIDPASLVAAGLDDELTRQRDLGRATLAEVLEVPTEGTWALDRPVDAAALDALRSRGIFRFVVDGDLVTGGNDRGPVRLPAGVEDVRAVVAPTDLRLTPSDDPVLSVHDLLARLALPVPGSGAGGAAPAAVIAIDPATVDPEALGLLLDALALPDDPFTARPLSALFGSPADQPAPTLVAPAPAALGAYRGEALAAHADLLSFGSMVGDRTDLLVPFERPLAISAAADLPLADRRAALATVTAALAEQFAAVSIPTSDKVTLGAREADFPVPISSEVDYPLQVLVEVTSSDRLDFPDDPILTTLESPRQEIKVRVVTNAPGDTPVRITVRTPDRRVVLAEGRYTVRSTAVSGMGLILTIGAGSFLALWWGRHWFRNRKAARHARHRRRSRRRTDTDTDTDTGPEAGVEAGAGATPV